jgi:GNAT superfamily N-acetyltransferase
VSALARCAFDTERLHVAEWHSVASALGLDLATVVSGMLTAGTTRALPEECHGDFTPERAGLWIAERDAESPTLLVIDRQSGAPLGLVIVFQMPGEDSDGVDVRLGYVLAEPAWGRGLASELVASLVGWCRGRSEYRSITGGVAADNEASARVLVKNGFAAGPVEPGGERIYELLLRP